MLTKLQFVEPSTYNVTSKKLFVPQAIAPEYLEMSFNFAFDMSFGNAGHHRNHRTGGTLKRKNAEIFVNAFQGKVAEFAFYQWLVSNGLNTALPDVSVMGKGIWDDTDFTVNEKKISVKSAAYFSNLMLLEKDDWNTNGDYIPNLENGNGSYDYFLLVRVKPDGKKLMKDRNLYHIDKVEKGVLKEMFFKESWWADISGFATKSDLRFVIENNCLIPKGSLLNGKMPMDASNYYLQSGDLRVVEDLLMFLR